MKTSAFTTPNASEPENGFLGIRRQFDTPDSNRIAQLVDLAKDGDEIAAAELETLAMMA